MATKRIFEPIDQRGPLRVMFMLTSMPVGGAETLLVNLVRGMDAQRFEPIVCCLKQRGPLGEELAIDFPVFENMIRGKYDLMVAVRLKHLMLEQNIDALITVGAGDKMFWGRIAAKRARVPVIASALHSTGWPDGIGRLNRMLTSMTDAFIGVADEHGRFLVEQENFPAEKVHVISNGIDTKRFTFNEQARSAVRGQLGISAETPVGGVVAALRPEKNLALFLEAAADVIGKLPEAQFIIVGDGPERSMLEEKAADMNIQQAVHFLGSRNDIPEVLSTLDLFSLSSHNEASPVSILEAMAIGLPIVAPRVGSIPDTVRDDENGFLVEAGQMRPLADRWFQLLSDLPSSRKLGLAGKEFVREHRSLESMVLGYENLITSIYSTKTNRHNDALLSEQVSVGDGVYS